MTIIGRLRASLLSEDLERHSAQYESTATEADRRAEQLQLLNREWSRIVDASPYYGEFAKQNNIPPSFESLEAYAAAVPVTSKGMVQEHGESIQCLGRPPYKMFMTGGSTNKPVRVPYWKSEVPVIQRDQWLGRRWYGITPSSPLFTLWGHGHLLGSGWKGWLNGRLRAVKDSLLGYTRFSAYDMREEAMRAAGDALVKAAPEYFLGFATALHHFAHFNADRKDEFRKLGLKVVLGTCERFPTPETAEKLADLFGCPVAMEYGAAEVGLMAHMHPEGGYRAFWKTLMIEAEPTVDDRHRLLITSLHPRCFPLVRYEIGDEIRVGGDVGRSAVRGLADFEYVVGRSYDYVELENGAMIHFDAITSAIKAWRDLRGFQVVCGDGPPRIDYLAPTDLPPEIEADLRLRLARVDESLRETPMRKVETLKQTAAGKTRPVIKQG